MPDDYNPVQCLQDEVRRFQATNTFNPMQVTGFYIQAAVVLNYVRHLEEHLDRLIKAVDDVCLHIGDPDLSPDVLPWVVAMQDRVMRAKRAYRFAPTTEPPGSHAHILTCILREIDVEYQNKRIELPRELHAKIANALPKN